MTIPADSMDNRFVFKNVPGISKFLEKQYAAMCDREELALMKYNMGKPKHLQKTIEQWIDPEFAYARSAPIQTS
jgi:hypothetical protein